MTRDRSVECAKGLRGAGIDFVGRAFVAKSMGLLVSSSPARGLFHRPERQQCFDPGAHYVGEFLAI